MAGACPVSPVDQVNWSTGQQGLKGPLAVTQGVAPGVPAQRGRRLNAGDAKRGGAARISPENAYRARGGAGLDSFERALSAASSVGRSIAGLGRNRRR